jgi:hypothetical protein
MKLNKDEILDRLADQGNVAQFVAFRPDASGKPLQSYSRLANLPANINFDSLADAITAVLAQASDGTVNVRSFAPESPRSHEFLYGLSDVPEIVAAVERLSSQGLHTIVNETIDIHDGGVSGVAQGSVIEFAPDDTPRCVERPGTAQLSFDFGMRLLETVYGFAPDLKPTNARVEFSIHPVRRGTRGGHTLLWEYEEGAGSPCTTQLKWPNRFSHHIGDKAYGLLMAWLMGLPVPRSTVIGRRIKPFTFGNDTGSFENWIRTCPVEPEPGLFTTARSWLDPFALLAREDPDGDRITSLMSQQAVEASYAGAAVDGTAGLIVEGKAGDGDDFMLGVVPPQELPTKVIEDVRVLHTGILTELSAARFEWVHDGKKAWIVQLHHGGTSSGGNVVVPGEAQIWSRFSVADGLEALRAFLKTMPDEAGVELVGQIGMTSHIADLVRRRGTPTRIVPA